MLSAEFGYNRDYVDKYINMPSLRALMDYREDNPPVGSILRIVFSDGKSTHKPKRKYKNKVEDEISPMLLTNTLKLEEKTSNRYKKIFEDAEALFKD